MAHASLFSVCQARQSLLRPNPASHHPFIPRPPLHPHISACPSSPSAFSFTPQSGTALPSKHSQKKSELDRTKSQRAWQEESHRLQCLVLAAHPVIILVQVDRSLGHTPTGPALAVLPEPS